MRVLKASDASVREAATIIREGGIVVYPTDTVYGLGALPTDPDATRRICEIKGRADKPLPVICSTIDIAKRIVDFNQMAEKLVEAFWPGALMLILPAKLNYPVWVTHGAKTLGVRIPDNVISRKLAEMSGGVIVSTSANKSGMQPPRDAGEAIVQIGDEVDLILDAGPSPRKTPSTVIDLTSEELWILRTGPITGKQIKEALSV
ncbi:MAG: L-threonylcarbamoyladenylate synthase [Candidatus Bathyarchaeia archaeon]